MIRKIVLAPGLFQIRPKPDFELVPEYQEPAEKVVPVVQEKIVVASVSAKANYQWRPDESRVFCSKCQAWQLPSWLPKEERGKSAESWFECSVCGCRHIELHYLSSEELELQKAHRQAKLLCEC